MKYSISRSIITCLLSGMLALCAGLFAVPTASAQLTRVSDEGAYQVFQRVKLMGLDNNFFILDDLHHQGLSKDGSYDIYRFTCGSGEVTEYLYATTDGYVSNVGIEFRREEEYARIASHLLTYTGMAVGMRSDEIADLVDRIDFQNAYCGQSPLMWVDAAQRYMIIRLSGEAGDPYAWYILAAFDGNDE